MPLIIFKFALTGQESLIDLKAALNLCIITNSCCQAFLGTNKVIMTTTVVESELNYAADAITMDTNDAALQVAVVT